MKILGYHDLRKIEGHLSLQISTSMSGIEFNLNLWQGETISVIGLRESSKILIKINSSTS